MSSKPPSPKSISGWNEREMRSTRPRSITARTHSERFDLVMGSGRRGQSYLYWKGGLLYQLPVSYLAAHRRMDQQPRLPGWRGALRPGDSAAMSASATRRRAPSAGQFLAGITCQKCHGRGRAASGHPQSRRAWIATARWRSARPAIPASAMAAKPMCTATRWACCGRASATGTARRCPVPPATTSIAWSRDLAAMSTRCVTCHAAPQP